MTPYYDSKFLVMLPVGMATVAGIACFFMGKVVEILHHYRANIKRMKCIDFTCEVHI